MRIMMLTDLYPPFIGGIEQHVRNLSLGLVRRGHEVSVVTMSGRGLPASEDDEGVRIFRLHGTAQRLERFSSPAGRPHAPPFPDPEIARAVRRLVRQERPQIVHGHNWMVRSFLPTKRVSGARLVVTLHDYGLVCAKRSFDYKGYACSGPGPLKCLECAGRNYGALRGAAITIGNWATRGQEFSAIDMFLPVSNAVAVGNELAARRLPYEVIPNFVPDDVASRADPADPALAALPKTPFWLFVGALSRHKGLHVLLAAYRSLEVAPPLVVIGSEWHDTPDQFPPNTLVLRSLAHGAVMAAWQRSQLALVPSIFPDPCPTVAMEAMACGLPVIASRVGGLPDIVGDGQTGILVAPADTAELGSALQQVLLRPEMARSMGEAGRKKVESFMATSVIARIEDTYAQVLARA